MQRGDRRLGHPGPETETIDKDLHAAVGQVPPAPLDPKQPNHGWLPYPRPIVTPLPFPSDQRILIGLIQIRSSIRRTFVLDSESRGHRHLALLHTCIHAGK